MLAGLLAGKEVITMSDAEVALEFLKFLLDKSVDVATSVHKKEDFLSLYRECLAAVQGKEA